MMERTQSVLQSEVRIALEAIELPGILRLPENPVGLVIFSHGSGSSRLSPRNSYVARILNEHGLGTLLFDLLTPEEDRIYDNRFDIPLLQNRLIQVTHWIGKQETTKGLPLGYFGASTGAASALGAAAQLTDEIKAVVSRGGRPDMAMDALPLVMAATLLLVGGWDQVVIELNEKAYANLKCERKLTIVPGASHLFEEPGKLEEVAQLSASWFVEWLS